MRLSIIASSVLLLAACGGATARPRARPSEAPGPLWVLAPHPDDEVLFGAEAIRRAVSERRPVSVVVMTNGDLGCERDGYLRERESIAGLAELGVAADRVHFLGYPDGHLAELGATPLAPLERRMADGACGLGQTTYAAEGAGHVDEHTRRTGEPAPYTASSAIGDLAALLEAERPSDIYVSHPIDEHPDHATTYVLLRRALERARLERLPRVHRALVHEGGCWPNGDRPREPCAPIGDVLGTPYPPLPAPIAAYAPNEHLVAADGGARARAAIAQYRSQLHVAVEHDWLGTFARGESIAWTEALTREGARIVRARGPGREEPRELEFDATLPPEDAITITIGAADLPLTITIAPDWVSFARGASLLRRVHVADVEGTHRWSLRADRREDDRVIELELRRDGAPVAYAEDLDLAALREPGCAITENATTVRNCSISHTNFR